MTYYCTNQLAHYLLQCTVILCEFGVNVVIKIHFVWLTRGMKFSRKFNFADCRFFVFRGTDSLANLDLRLYRKEQIWRISCKFLSGIWHDTKLVWSSKRSNIVFSYSACNSKQPKGVVCMLFELRETRSRLFFFALWRELVSSKFLRMIF